MAAADDDDVILVPDGRGGAVALDWETVRSFAEEHAVPIGRALVHLLSQPSSGGQRYYTLRPEDEAALRDLNPISVGGGYIRGFLFDDDKKFAHQVALRPADGAAAPAGIAPGELLLSAQMAAITAQLDDIARALEAVAIDVGRIIELLERDATAQVAAAVTTVRLVHRSLTRDGTISGTDWQRVAHLEQVIAHRHIAVLTELEAFARDVEFTGHLPRDTRLTERYPAARIRDLLAQEAALREAGLRWIALYAAIRLAEGADDPTAVLDCRDRHDDLTEQADAAVAKVRKALHEAREPRLRNFLQLAFAPNPKDGGVPGRRADERRREAVLGYRANLAVATEAMTAPSATRMLEMAPAAAALPAGRPSA